MAQLIVLGWDALDIELVEQYGLEDSFGVEQTKIETYVNPIIDEPHTRELWPSMITGLHPDEHGVHAVSENDGVQWNNPLLNMASTLANGVVPQPVLDAIGRQLRENGAGLDQKQTSYYTENGVDTVFGPTDRAISIPNYETSFDGEHGLDATRDTVWKDLLVDRDGTEGFDPDITTEGMYGILGEEVGKRLSHTITSMQQGHGLTWTWFGCLDTVGHMAPTVDADLERDFYHVAAKATETVRELSPEDATVVSVSDHGLQDGEHTHYATLCGPTDACTSIDSVFDIAAWVGGENTTSNGERHSIGREQMQDTKEQLEKLGYV